MSWQWGVAFATNFTIFFLNLFAGLIISFDPWAMNRLYSTGIKQQFQPACILRGCRGTMDCRAAHQCFFEGFALSNQLLSRHSRNAMRARCNMTHKLLSEMFSVRQISLPGMSSISRIINTSATR
jgi:hypothetical protein